MTKTETQTLYGETFTIWKDFEVGDFVELNMYFPGNERDHQLLSENGLFPGRRYVIESKPNVVDSPGYVVLKGIQGLHLNAWVCERFKPWKLKPDEYEDEKTQEIYLDFISGRLK